MLTQFSPTMIVGILFILFYKYSYFLYYERAPWPSGYFNVESHGFNFISNP